MFDINEQLLMFDQLKYDGCEAAMTKERAFSFYIPTSLKYFEGLKKGENPEETSQEKQKEIKDSFYRICERLKETELPKEFLSDTKNVERFYRHRGQMLGIPTDFLKPEMSGEEIFSAWTDAYWKKVEPLLKNPALGEYMFASRAKDSELFWCFLVGSASYLAIETAYRFGFTPVGTFREATLDDPLSLWTYRDEAYLYQKWRDDQFRSEIENATEALALGAGGMPEIRRTGFLDGKSEISQNIFACDSDPRIDFEFLASELPEKIREKIDYRKVDLSTMLAMMMKEERTFDLIYIKGVLSFMTDRIEPVTAAVMQLLRPGGKFLFDMQLSHFAMLRDACIFGWGGGASDAKIELLPKDDAMKIVYNATDNLGISRGRIPEPVVMKDPFIGDEFGMNVTILKT